VYRFYFEDNLTPVEWWDHPGNAAGPWRTASEALDAFAGAGVAPDPADVCYILMTEEQAAKLRSRLGADAGA
jgi:hypothetical protein